MLHPADKPRVPYVTQCLKDAPGVFVAASDYLKVLPDAIDRWLPSRCTRSAPTASAAAKTARPLRDFFEVDARFIALATLSALLEEGKSTRRSCAGDQGPRHQPREAEPGDELDDCEVGLIHGRECRVQQRRGRPFTHLLTGAFAP